jgi:hypothetical protein
MFSPRLHNATKVIVTLMAYCHVPMIDDLEFTWMVDGGEDLIFDALH